MDDEKIQKGTAPSDEDKFFIEWGRETVKENIKVLNDSLRLFITLDTAIISGYLTFFEKINIHSNILKIIPISVVIMSLIIAICGVYPTSIEISMISPSQIKNFKQDRFNSKKRGLFWSSLFLIFAFLLYLTFAILQQ